jgi:hypothetical protein
MFWNKSVRKLIFLFVITKCNMQRKYLYGIIAAVIVAAVATVLIGTGGSVSQIANGPAFGTAELRVRALEDWYVQKLQNESPDVVSKAVRLDDASLIKAPKLQQALAGALEMRSYNMPAAPDVYKISLTKSELDLIKAVIGPSNLNQFIPEDNPSMIEKDLGTGQDVLVQTSWAIVNYKNVYYNVAISTISPLT